MVSEYFKQKYSVIHNYNNSYRKLTKSVTEHVHDAKFKDKCTFAILNVVFFTCRGEKKHNYVRTKEKVTQ